MMSWQRHVVRSVCVLVAGVAVMPGCSSDDDDTTGTPAVCTSTGGPVDGVADDHCIGDDGQPITQTIGICSPDGEPAAGGGGAGGAASDEEPDETYTIRHLNQSADDDCKYDTSFTNSCIEVGKPVTFTLKLATRAVPGAATDARPASPEIFLADNPSHISPSNSITAKELSAGTYQIGPIVFDESGRWVVRFHFYERCSDIPDDSPHGHVAYYLDVP